jgi:endonuclease YncB( thermonuclease family)
MKQIEYTYYGLEKEYVFKLKDTNLRQIEEFMLKKGIAWYADERDESADYIKFIPRQEEEQ